MKSLLIITCIFKRRTTTNQQIRKFLFKKGNQQTISKKPQNFY
jgi:hypothetical protein